IHNAYTLTDINGDYTLPFHDSNTLYRLKVVAPDYWTISSNPNAFTIYPDTQSVINRHFGLNAMPYVFDIRISATALNVPQAGKQVTMSATYQNIGTALITGDTVSLVKDARYSLVSATPMPDVVQGNTLKWAYTNLQVEEYRQILVTLLTNNTVLPTDTLHSTWTAKPLTGDTIPGNNQVVLHQRGNVPIAPNGKSVIPEGPTLSQQEMVYTIRFQNTSNGYVPENIVIRDTLNSNLDLSTFRLVGSTHPMTYTLSGSGILTFKFQNINLPDSNVNEPASHGAVSFSIKPKPGLAANTQIPNRAGIYFDFLPGVGTNTTQNTIILQWPNSIDPVTTPNSFGLVYPNPCGHQFTLQLLANQGPIHARIVNALGATLLEETVQGEGLHHFNTAHWAQGMYYLILSNARSKQVISFIHE
ncbi:MAG: T9SS type A sorting domain-containing protein, partial [Chitinophagaceae bacterium]|nr:T9SS type A sorting domain-containing protein [Chitinophagaceae bacterium]